jgi:nitric oxide reductase NorD protein
VVEPEGLLIEGARRAAVVARELWWRARSPATRGELPLSRVKQRLELFTVALYGAVPPIRPSDPPPPPTWLARVLGRAQRHLASRTARATTDGTTIWLPRAIPVGGDDASAFTTYRLLAVEQAARASRGTPAFRPADPLERDLYALAEAVAVDHQLVRRFAGLAPAVRAARASALVDRPPFERLRPVECRVERMLRAVLAADPASPPRGIPLAAAPADSVAWARVTAARWRGAGNRYRAVAHVSLWGEAMVAPPGEPGRYRPDGHDDDPRRGPARSASLRHRPRVRDAAGGEDDDRPGTWMIRADEPMESVEDPMGLQRPADRAADPGAADLADSLSELPEARVVHTPGSPSEVLESDAGAVPRASARGVGEGVGPGIVYPEWDYRCAGYHQQGAVVWPITARAGSEAWVGAVMARHAALVRRVRRRFEGLRPRRQRVNHQDDGPDLDLAAYVSAFADWRAGCSGDDRLYVAARPARRDLAIALLVDASASTDGWISGGLRVIDLEKESLIVLLEALDALGDRHAALAFSADGPRRVRVLTIKDFAEPVGPSVRRRVAALEPDGYTRFGAAIRHASALLARQPARHRLLLILSDGKPNDVDQYQGRYGVEDTRQAVAEARLQGLVPFCLTVDRQAPGYMPSIFGPRGYALLPRQELLPAVLVDVVRRLLTR